MKTVDLINRENTIFKQRLNSLRNKHEKKINRLTVKNMLDPKNGVRVRYVRDKQNRPVGVVVSKLENDCQYIGYSRMSDEDVANYGKVYNRDVGILSAVARLVPQGQLLNKPMRDDVRKVIAIMVFQNTLYYQGK